MSDTAVVIESAAPEPRPLDRTRIAETADPQATSQLFASLPLEVRKMIYVEFWRLDGEGSPDDGLRQHIYREPHGRGMGHFPCLLDQRRAPNRNEEDGFHSACRSGPAPSEVVAWEKGVMTDWGLHWPCQAHLKKKREDTAQREAHPEQQEGGRREVEQERGEQEAEDPAESDCVDPACSTSTWSPFLPAMLACKRMYLECSESIYDTVTFHLTDTAQAADFIGSRLPSLPCRSVEISLRVTPLLTELYFGPDGGEKAVVAGRPPVTADNNPWQRLCDALVRTSRRSKSGGGGMRDIRIWLDSSDLRPWHKRVVETRFFSRLLAVERPTGEFFVDVPYIPEEVEKRGLPGCYLEDIPRNDLPFEFERSRRTNNWLAHLNRVSHLRFSSQRL